MKIKLFLAMVLTLAISAFALADDDYKYGPWHGEPNVYNNGKIWVWDATTIVEAPNGNVSIEITGHAYDYYWLNPKIKYELFYVTPGNPPTYTLVDSGEFDLTSTYPTTSSPFTYSGASGYYAVYYYLANDIWWAGDDVYLDNVYMVGD